MGADNQQERLAARAFLKEPRTSNIRAETTDLDSYLVGFADGEGSFNVSFRPRIDYRTPWKISLCFNISQRDDTVLRLFQQSLRCGTFRQRRDGVWYYEVNNLRDILGKVIPFFEQHPLRSVRKQRDFVKFQQIAELVANGAHSNREGVEAILSIRREMNGGGKRRYAEEEILQRFDCIGSSETVRRTLRFSGDEDTVRAPGRPGEASRNADPPDLSQVSRPRGRK